MSRPFSGLGGVRDRAGGPVRDVHDHMLAPDNIKAAILEGQLSNASDMVTDFAAEGGAFRKKGGDGHIGWAEIAKIPNIGSRALKKSCERRRT